MAFSCFVIKELCSLGTTTKEFYNEVWLQGSLVTMKKFRVRQLITHCVQERNCLPRFEAGESTPRR